MSYKIYNNIPQQLKNEISLFVTTWMGLDSIILNEIDRNRQVLYDYTYTESKNQNKWINVTDRNRE